MLNKDFKNGDSVEFDVLYLGEIDSTIKGKIVEIKLNSDGIQRAIINSGIKYTGTDKDVLYSAKLVNLRSC